MGTTAKSETAWLQSISPAERMRFMSTLAHCLTIATRVLCHSAGPCEQVVEQLRQLNEAQHQVTAYLSYCLKGAEDPHYIQRVVASVLGVQGDVALQQSEQAWSHAKREFEAAGGA